MAHPILKGRARFLKTIQRSECIQALTAKPEIAITQSGLAHRSRHPKQARGCRKSGQSATRSSALSATLSVRNEELRFQMLARRSVPQKFHMSHVEPSLI